MITIKRFLIIDGHGIAYRGFYAIKTKLTAPDGTPTAMIAGFMNMFFRVQDDLMPDVNIVVFDARGKTFRHELLSTYKADRKPLDNDLGIQLPILQELLRLIGCTVLVLEGVEADDAAASFARLAQSENHEVMLLSSDKDLLQLVGSGIQMMRPIKNGIAGSEIYNFTEFEYSDIKQITEEISEAEITKEAVKLIYDKAKSFRKIVQIIDMFEKAAQANGLTKIDENIAQEVLNGGF